MRTVLRAGAPECWEPRQYRTRNLRNFQLPKMVASRSLKTRDGSTHWMMCEWLGTSTGEDVLTANSRKVSTNELRLD